MKYSLLALWVSIHMLCANVTHAETVLWVTESWHNFTDKDGSGLYNDIVKAVFAEHQLDIINMPWKRSLIEVKKGSAGITGATSIVEGYIAPRYPILATPISILFIKDKLSFTDMSSLEEHVGVWASPFEDELFQEIEKGLLNGFSVQERKTAYKLLVSGRADYFIDAKALHQNWLQTQKAKDKDAIHGSGYQLEDIHRSNLYMIFTDNARGQRLKTLFDSGMDKLIQQGRLRKLYEKYDLLEQMPASVQ